MKKLLYSILFVGALIACEKDEIEFLDQEVARVEKESIQRDQDNANALAVAQASLQAAIDAEKAAREAGDANLSANLSEAVATLSSAIADEANARAAGDAQLAADLKANIDMLVALLAKEEEARIAGDQANADALADAVGALSAALSAERNARIAGDANLSAAISSLNDKLLEAVAILEAADAAIEAASEAGDDRLNNRITRVRDNLRDRITNVRQNVKQFTRDKVNDAKDELEQAIADVQAEVDGNTSAISELQAALDTVSSTLSGLGDRVDALDSDNATEIAAIKEQLETLEANINSAYSETQLNYDDIQDLQSQLTDLLARIEALEPTPPAQLGDVYEFVGTYTANYNGINHVAVTNPTVDWADYTDATSFGGFVREINYEFSTGYEVNPLNVIPGYIWYNIPTDVETVTVTATHDNFEGSVSVTITNPRYEAPRPDINTVLTAGDVLDPYTNTVMLVVGGGWGATAHVRAETEVDVSGGTHANFQDQFDGVIVVYNPDVNAETITVTVTNPHFMGEFIHTFDNPKYATDADKIANAGYRMVRGDANGDPNYFADDKFILQDNRDGTYTLIGVGDFDNIDDALAASDIGNADISQSIWYWLVQASDGVLHTIFDAHGRYSENPDVNGFYETIWHDRAFNGSKTLPFKVSKDGFEATVEITLDGFNSAELARLDALRTTLQGNVQAQIDTANAGPDLSNAGITINPNAQGNGVRVQTTGLANDVNHRLEVYTDGTFLRSTGASGQSGSTIYAIYDADWAAGTVFSFRLTIVNSDGTTTDAGELDGTYTIPTPAPQLGDATLTTNTGAVLTLRESYDPGIPGEVGYIYNFPDGIGSILIRTNYNGIRVSVTRSDGQYGSISSGDYSSIQNFLDNS